MTFWANREGDSKHVDVHVTYGPITIKVTEDPGHLRAFWGELGKLLEQFEKSKPEV